jgi:hypothetical protein
LPRRIERQQRLQPHQAVDDQETADMEQQHGDRIGQPMLLALFVDAADPIKRRFNRPQHRRHERALAAKDARHVPAERLYQRDHDRAVEKDLDPADECHGKAFQYFRAASSRLTSTTSSAALATNASTIAASMVMAASEPLRPQQRVG